MLIALLIFLGLIVVVVMWVVGVYNGLIRLRNQVKEAWAQVDVQLKRRFDLIPNLMETVKGYMNHERETLEAVTQARSAVQNAGGMEERMAAEAGLPVTPHCANLSMVTLFTMHVLRAIPNAGKYLEFSIEGEDYYPWQQDLFVAGVPTRCRPGLGVEEDVVVQLAHVVESCFLVAIEA